MKIQASGALAALCTVAATQVAAFDHNRTEVSLAYQDTSYFTSSFHGMDAQVKSDFGLSPAMGAQVDLGYSETSLGTSDFTRTTLGLHVYAELANDVRAGGFVQQTTFDYGFGPGEVTATYYGVEGMITPLPNLSIEAYYGMGQYDLGTTFDMTTFGTQISYGFTPNLAMRLSSDFDTIDTGLYDYAQSSYAIGADYYMNGSFPMIFSAEIGQVGSNVSMDRAAIKLTIPFGGGNDSNARKLFGTRGAIAKSLLPIT